jgi:hypothetical protein
VLRLLKDEELDALSREVGVTAAVLSEWREKFLAGAGANLKRREPEPADDEVPRLKAMVGELMKTELLAEKARLLEGNAPGLPWRSREDETALTDEALLEAIRGVLATSPFPGEGHRKVWARLRAQDVRTSRARCLRLMHQAELLAPGSARRVLGPRHHDGTITTDNPDVA